MNEGKHSLLAQVAEEATITVEQAAEVLGLGRTAAYEAARRGDFPARTRPPGDRPGPSAARVAGGVPVSRLDHWTGEEVDRFLSASAGTRLEAAWHLVALAGLRAGELLGLRWADVDLDAEILRIENALPGVPYRAIAPAPLTERARMIEIDRALSAILVRHSARQKAERSEWGDAYAAAGLVVCRENGQPLHPRDIGRAFEAIARRQDLAPTRLSALRCAHVLAEPEPAT